MNNVIASIEKIISSFANSIRKKLLLCFTIIIAAMVFASGYTYFSGRALNELYNSTLEKHLLLNNLFLNLAATNDLLEKYLRSGMPEVLDKYNKSYPVLFEFAKKYEDSAVNEKGSRAATDLKYMIQTYVEEANSAITLRSFLCRFHAMVFKEH